MESTVIAILTVLNLGLVLILIVVSYRALKKGKAKQVRINELKTQVIDEYSSTAYLAHEIRTPLTIIKGCAELLADAPADQLSPTQREFARTIDENATNIISLAEDFLTLFSLEKSLLNLNIQKYELRGIVREAVTDYRLMHECDILLDNRGAPMYVDADIRLLKQAIWNLFNNSLIHGGENTKISVSVSGQDGIALLQVEDDGVGISAEVAQKAWESYVTGEGIVTVEKWATGTVYDEPGRDAQEAQKPPRSFAGTALPRSGSGIGLDMVERIMRAHRGCLLIDTNVGKGSRVLIQLPLRGSKLDLSKQKGQ